MRLRGTKAQKQSELKRNTMAGIEEAQEVPAAAENVAEVEYVCPPEFDEKEDLCKMFVAGLAKEITDEEFKGMFEKFGTVKESVVMRKNESKSDRLFGFITFAKCDNLDDCLLERPYKYKERELDVKRAIPKGKHDGTDHFKVKKLHLGNVPAIIDTDNLLRYLESRHPKKYGTIIEVDILKEKDESGNATEKNRGFGFISVSSEDFADRISIAESSFILDGNSLRINKAKPRAIEGGLPNRGFRGKGQVSQGGGWNDWGYSGYGGGYGYSNYNGYGGGYYNHGHHSPYSGYGGPSPAKGGWRYAPY